MCNELPNIYTGIALTDYSSAMNDMIKKIRPPSYSPSRPSSPDALFSPSPLQRELLQPLGKHHKAKKAVSKKKKDKRTVPSRPKTAHLSRPREDGEANFIARRVKSANTFNNGSSWVMSTDEDNILEGDELEYEHDDSDEGPDEGGRREEETREGSSHSLRKPSVEAIAAANDTLAEAERDLLSGSRSAPQATASYDSPPPKIRRSKTSSSNNSPSGGAADEYSEVYEEEGDADGSFYPDDFVDQQPNLKNQSSVLLPRDSSVQSFVSGVMDEAISLVLSPLRPNPNPSQGDLDIAEDEEGFDLGAQRSHVRSQETKEFKSIISFISNTINSIPEDPQDIRPVDEDEEEAEEALDDRVMTRAESSLISIKDNTENDTEYDDDFTEEQSRRSKKQKEKGPSGKGRPGSVRSASIAASASASSVKYEDDFVAEEGGEGGRGGPQHSSSLLTPSASALYEEDFDNDNDNENEADKERKSKVQALIQNYGSNTAHKGREKGGDRSRDQERSKEVWRLIAAEEESKVDFSDRRNLPAVLNDIVQHANRVKNSKEKTDKARSSAKGGPMQWIVETLDEDKRKEDHEGEMEKEERMQGLKSERLRGKSESKTENQIQHYCHYCTTPFIGEGMEII